MLDVSFALVQIHSPLSFSLKARLEVDVWKVAAGLYRSREAGRSGANDLMRKVMAAEWMFLKVRVTASVECSSNSRLFHNFAVAATTGS